MKLKKYHKSGNKLLVVEYGISATNHLYFSVTGHTGRKTPGRYTDPIYDAEGNKYECSSAGRIHDEILKVFPSMADIISLHLSDIDGTPIHALEDGFYNWSRGDYDEVKSLLRLTDEQLAELLDIMRGSGEKNSFANYVATQKARWKSEADAIISKYNLPVPETK